MPVYRCAVPAGALNADQKQRIAVAITDVHCGISAAPRNFVQVIYEEAAEGTTDKPSPYYVFGVNRAGRPPEIRAEILDGIIGSICDIAGVSRDKVDGRILEAPASWIMEAGAILPEPGEETAEWFEHAEASG